MNVCPRLLVDLGGGMELHDRLITHLVSVGAEWILASNRPRAIAYAICIIKMQFLADTRRGKVRLSDMDRCVEIPARDMMGDDERGTAMFFSKKVECDCFKELKKKYKCEKKMGCCSFCKETIERKRLMHCSACQSAQYCSTGEHKFERLSQTSCKPVNNNELNNSPFLFC